MLEVALTARRPRAELDHDRAAPPEYDFRRFFLTRPREQLYRRIDARCERIAADGLLPVRARARAKGARQTCLVLCLVQTAVEGRGPQLDLVLWDCVSSQKPISRKVSEEALPAHVGNPDVMLLGVQSSSGLALLSQASLRACSGP